MFLKVIKYLWSEDILKYIESNHKIRYWLILKLPYFRRTKEYIIVVKKNNLFTPFISILTKRVNDKHLFVLGALSFLGFGVIAKEFLTSKKQIVLTEDDLKKLKQDVKEEVYKEHDINDLA